MQQVGRPPGHSCRISCRVNFPYRQDTSSCLLTLQLLLALYCCSGRPGFRLRQAWRQRYPRCRACSAILPCWPSPCPEHRTRSAHSVRARQGAMGPRAQLLASPRHRDAARYLGLGAKRRRIPEQCVACAADPGADRRPVSKRHSLGPDRGPRQLRVPKHS